MFFFFFVIIAKIETGSCWVHHWCAVWSEGVEQTEGEVLINVDKAVISGIQRVGTELPLSKL